MTQNNEEYKDINLKSLLLIWEFLRRLVRNFTNRRQIVFHPKHEARICYLSLFSIMGSHLTPDI